MDEFVAIVDTEETTFLVRVRAADMDAAWELVADAMAADEQFYEEICVYSREELAAYAPETVWEEVPRMS